ncbi:Tkl/drk protein kinase, partial [Globisporangium splendens]
MVSAANVTLPVPLNSTFVFDGNTSDLAQQFYARYAAGDTAPVLTTLAAADMPLVQTRIENAGAASFAELPGLLQLALLWDTGYVLDPKKKLIQVLTLGGRSMADIFVTKQEFEVTADCQSMNCTDPMGHASFKSKICNGDQILKVTKCIASDFTQSESIHSALWATGSNPSAIPDINILDHSWIDDGSGESYSVYAIHTGVDTAGYGNCPTDAYDAVVIPCFTKSKTPQATLAQMSAPKTSVWIDTWLAAFPESATSTSSSDGSSTGSSTTSNTSAKSSSSGIGGGAIAGIIVGVVVVIGIIAFIVVRKRKSRDQDSTAKPVDGVDPNVLLTPNTKHLSQEGMSGNAAVGTSSGMTMRPTEDDYGSSGGNSVLKALYSDPNLVNKRMIFEKLQFEKLLSKGAYGEVWICQYDGQQIAVKRLLQSKQHTFEEVREFTNEIQLSASLRHPNIVEFVGVAWNSLENLVMAVEYLPSGDLQNYLKKNRDLLSWARDKIHMALGIARALEYIHGRTPPLIHRDVKSKNVLLTERLDAKLIDFGVSRNFELASMTAGVGTPYWTAPEILEGTKYSEQSDIYSFGVLLSELDTGELPYFDASSTAGEKLKPFQILNDVMAGTLHPSFTDECPPRIRKVAELCFQRDPSKRPSAAELVQLLEG